MTKPACAALAFLTASLTWSEAQAVDVSACKDALITSTYNKFSTSDIDYRMASFVTKDEYNKQTQDAGLNVVIYGVPVGANWDQFQENIKKYTSSYSTSLTTSEAESLMQTGLDPNSPSVYADCLRSQVLSLPGLHLAIVGGSKTDVTLVAKWTIAGDMPRHIWPRWQTASGVIPPGLPKDLFANDAQFSVKRPNDEFALNVNFRGWADGAKIEPIPKTVVVPQFSVEGKWCKAAGIPYMFYLHQTGQHMDFYVDGLSDAVTDLGYFGYFFQHRPPTETPLFSNRQLISGGQTFSLIDTYSPTGDPTHKHDWRTTEYTFKFIDQNVLQLIHSSVTDQSGLTSQGLFPTEAFTRCGGLPARIIEPKNGEWRSSLQAIETGDGPHP